MLSFRTSMRGVTSVIRPIQATKTQVRSMRNQSQGWGGVEVPPSQHSLIMNYPPTAMPTVLNMCQKGQEMVVTRLGSFHAVHREGLFFTIPFLDKIVVHDMREIPVRIDPQTSITKDNAMVHISGNVYFRVVDSVKATFNVNQPIYALVQHAQAVMRRSIGNMELDETFRSREETPPLGFTSKPKLKEINAVVRSSLAESCERWGLEVMRYEVRDEPHHCHVWYPKVQL